MSLSHPFRHALGEPLGTLRIRRSYANFLSMGAVHSTQLQTNDHNSPQVSSRRRRRRRRRRVGSDSCATHIRCVLPPPHGQAGRAPLNVCAKNSVTAHYIYLCECLVHLCAFATRSSARFTRPAVKTLRLQAIGEPNSAQLKPSRTDQDTSRKITHTRSASTYARVNINIPRRRSQMRSAALLLH